MQRLRPAAARIVVGAFVVLALGGCAAATRASDVGALSSLSESVDESASATATATLVVDLVAAGRMPRVTADTALGNAVSAADAASHAAATITVPDAATLAAQKAALTAVQEAARTVVGARAWLAGEGEARTADEVRAALDESGAALEDVSEDLDDTLGQGSS